MSDSPTQTFLIQLPSSLSRRISVIVDYPDSPYESISEFIKVAAENQLVLDNSFKSSTEALDCSEVSQLDPSITKTSIETKRAALAHAVAAELDASPSQHAASVARGNVDSIDLLELPTSHYSVRPPIAFAGHSLSALTNRLSPLLAGPRVLANLSSASESAPKIDTFIEAAARVARNLGLLLRDEDDFAGRRGRLRRSTAWPIGDDEAKSLIRYRNSFMLSSDGKGAVGPLIDFQFVAVVDGEAFLTEVGAAVAREAIPAIDQHGAADLMTEKLRRLFSESLVQIPGEAKEIRLFLEAVEETKGEQDLVDRQLSSLHLSWSEAQVVSHRAAMIGRLRDLAVIEVESTPKTKIVPGTELETFIRLLDTSARTIQTTERKST